MKEIEDLFKLVEHDYDAFYNLSMFIMTIFVNKGIVELQWDISTQKFVFTVNDNNVAEELSSPRTMDINPDEILARMTKRKKK